MFDSTCLQSHNYETSSHFFPTRMVYENYRENERSQKGVVGNFKRIGKEKKKCYMFGLLTV